MKLSKKLVRRISCMLSVLSMILMFSGQLVASATSVTSSDAYSALNNTCQTGYYLCATDNTIYDYSTKFYASTGGGQYLYTEISGLGVEGNKGFVNDPIFNSLKAAEKTEFLQDMFRIANAMVKDTDNGNGGHSSGVSTDTLDMMMTNLQDRTGVGTTVLSSLLSEAAQPRWGKALKMFGPFSGPVGTGIALITILILAALAVSMALDIAYIAIPIFQTTCGGGEGADGKQNKSSIGGWISMEAKKAVKAADGGEGGQAGSGDYKAAVWIYLKYRWKSLVALGLCIVYLMAGRIFGLVGFVVDLFTGVL